MWVRTLLIFSMATVSEPSPPISVAVALQRANVCTPHGTHASKCGYCKSKRDSSVSFGVTCPRLDVVAYQGLMDRGWRRSGTYFYKPDDTKCCCQHTPIRLDVHSFVAAKEQSRLLRRFQAYLRGEIDLTAPSPVAPTTVTPPASRSDRFEPALLQLHDDVCHASREALTSLSRDEVAVLTPILHRICGDERTCVCSRVPRRLKDVTLVPDDAGAMTLHANMTSDIVVRVAAMARSTAGVENATVHAFAAAVVRALVSVREDVRAHVGERLHINILVPDAPSPPAPAASAAAGPAAAGATKRPKRADAAAAAPTTAAPHRFRVEVHPSAFHEESYALYVRYQMKVHGDATAPTREQYTRFLCTSPLTREPADAARGQEPFSCGPRDAATPTDAVMWAAPCGVALQRTLTAASDAWTRTFTSNVMDAGASVPAAVPRDDLRALEGVLHASGDVHVREQGYGSFHHRYYLDDKLVCVCVNDHTPVCISSVYVFYNPDMRAFAWGKLSALREIVWTAAMARSVPSCHYVYLGFYIHTCIKMRYKAEYEPSDLLCPVTRMWVPYNAAKVILDAAKGKFMRLAAAGSAADEEAIVRAAGEEAARVGLFMARACLCLSTIKPDSLAMLKELNPRGRTVVMPLLRDMASAMGPDVASTLLVLIQ